MRAEVWAERPMFALGGGAMITAPDGYQYGVRFTDGSVAARWSGRTQCQRAEEYLERVLALQRAWIAESGYDREPDRLVLVRRRPGEPWEAA
jgi:hypothetical protein